MDLKQIKELMAAMEKAGIKKLTLKEKTGYELHLERQDELSQMVVHPAMPTSPHMHFMPHTARPPEFPHPAQPQASVEEKSNQTQAKSEAKEGKYIQSPMVGTFYASPSPDDAPFVKVGDRVDENTVVCIIEAMKVMNEVKAGVSGTVAEICLESGHPVEFGTKLIRVV